MEGKLTKRKRKGSDTVLRKTIRSKVVEVRRKRVVSVEICERTWDERE